MSLEIKELHIKVNVNPPEEQGASGNGTAAATAGQAKENAAHSQEELVAACVEQVLQILQERKEA